MVLKAKDVDGEDRRRLAGQADRVLRKGQVGLDDLPYLLRPFVPPKRKQSANWYWRTDVKLLILVGLACLVTEIAAAQVADTTISSKGNWDLRKLSTGSDDASCVLTPKTPSRVQVTRGRIDLTGMPKNSIFNYQYRVDDGPASTPVFPSETMQAEGKISIDGDAVKDIVKGQRFRFRILDRWHEAISEDVDLNGLGALYEQLQAKCR